ncbi:MAG: hypothetical protein ACRDN0_24995 [Trebonia sp.]
MADEDGTVTAATVTELVTDPRFEFPAAAPQRGTSPGIGLEGLPVAEVVYGLRPDAPAGTRPKPEYDPGRTSTQ